MKILADENVDFGLVTWLRAAGHDVRWITESAPSLSDESVAEQAWSESRAIITLDRDFGELVFRRRFPVVGLAYLRLRADRPVELLSMFRKAWTVVETRLIGSFVVVSNRIVRIRPLPGA